jgi:hypothetical protein
MIKQREADRANRPEEPKPTPGLDKIEQWKQELEKAKQGFDPKYDYSDDHSYWREQNGKWNTIQRLTKLLKDQGVMEADKHSMLGKIQRGNELKKKVDSSWTDISNAQRAGDKAAGSKAFRKHERYANLERPGTWTKSVGEGEKNPHTSALGKALYRDLSKEKKASPAQVQRNKERWAQRQAEREQGANEDHSTMGNNGKPFGAGSYATASRDTSKWNGAGHDDAVHENDAYMESLSAKLAEKLKPNDPVDKYIHDFEKGAQTPNAKGHHQFRNKSKEKVRQMAIAASYGAKNKKKK